MKLSSVTKILPLLAILSSFQVMAEAYTENNRQINYIRETGFGEEGMHAALMLETQASLAAGCLWDLILIDPSTEAGKKALTELQSAEKAGATLKTISFTKSEETSDCLLESFEI